MEFDSMLKCELGIIDGNNKRWKLQEMGITQSLMLTYSLGITYVNERLNYKRWE